MQNNSNNKYIYRLILIIYIIFLSTCMEAILINNIKYIDNKLIIDFLTLKFYEYLFQLF